MDKEKLIKDIIYKCANDANKLESIKKKIIENIDRMNMPKTAKIEIIYDTLKHYPIN